MQNTHTHTHTEMRTHHNSYSLLSQGVRAIGRFAASHHHFDIVCLQILRNKKHSPDDAHMLKNDCSEGELKQKTNQTTYPGYV